MSLMGAVNAKIRSGNAENAEKDYVVNSSIITDLLLFDQYSSVLREELKLLIV